MSSDVLCSSFCRKNEGYYRVVHGLLKHCNLTWEFCNLLRTPRMYTELGVPEHKVTSDLDTVSLREVLRTRRPKVWLVVADYWCADALEPVLKQCRTQGTITLLYCAIDAYKLDRGLVEKLNLFDHLVPFTFFAKAILEDHGAHPTDPIYHGIDTDICRNLARPGERLLEKTTRVLKGLDRSKMPPSFAPMYYSGAVPKLILVSASNVYRKRLDVALDVFSILAKKRNDVFLVLNTDWKAKARVGLNIQAYCLSQDIPTDRLINPLDLFEDPFSPGSREVLCNAACLGLNTSMGEGFGLSPFYHGLTGAAQVMPRHSALPELWRGAAALVDAPLEGEARVIDRGWAAAWIEHILSGEGALSALGRSAEGCARQLAWSRVSHVWNHVLGGLCA